MGSHLIEGEFQSDKYPSTPRGKVPLSCKDEAAQDLLWEYAQRRRSVDAEFSDDLEEALRLAGFDAAAHTTQKHSPNEISRRILGRWHAFNEAVKKLEEWARRVPPVFGAKPLLDEIERVRMGIGGQP